MGNWGKLGFIIVCYIWEHVQIAAIVSRIGARVRVAIAVECKLVSVGVDER